MNAASQPDYDAALWNEMARIAAVGLANPDATEDEKTAMLFFAGGMDAEPVIGELPSWNLKPKPGWSLKWDEGRWTAVHLTCAPDAELTISVGNADDPVPVDAIQFTARTTL